MIARSEDAVTMSQQPIPIEKRRAASPNIARVVALLLAISLGFVFSFMYLGQEVRESATTSVDLDLLHRVAETTRRWPLALSETVSLFGTAPIIVVITAVASASLARYGRWYDIALLIAAAVGAVLLSPLTKHLVSRARPTAFFRTAATGYSFPSGHTLNATCVALALMFILWRLPWHRSMKIVWTLVLVGYVACVGASRIVLGVHYPTDVLGGFLLGVAWTTLLMTLVLGAERWRAARQKSRSGL